MPINLDLFGKDEKQARKNKKNRTWKQVILGVKENERTKRKRA